MKFLKTGLIILSSLVIFSAVVSYGGGQSSKEEHVKEDISDFENAINNGEIITDGLIEDDNNLVAQPNAIGKWASTVGEKVSSWFSSFLKMIGNLISSFI